MDQNKAPTFRFSGPALIGITFLVLYLLLSKNNRLASDDFYYLKNVEDHGIWNGMLVSYHRWITRWSSLLFLNIIFTISGYLGSLLPYHVFTIAALIGMVFLLIKIAGRNYLPFPLSLRDCLAFSVLFSASFFFFTFGTGESWFWVSSTAMYLWSVIALLAAAVLFFSELNSKGLLWRRILFSCCFLFIGGAAESVSLCLLILITFAALLRLRSSNYSLKDSFRDKHMKLFFTALFCLCIALLVSYSGKGRMLRASALPAPHVTGALWVSFKSFGKFLLFYLPLKLHWFLFFSVPWICLGGRFPSAKKEGLEKTVLQILRIALLFFLLIFVSFLPASFLLSETGPLRTWIPASLFIACWCAASGFYLGMKINLKQKTSGRLNAVAAAILLFLISVNIVQQYELTPNYARAVDHRMHALAFKKLNGETKTVSLPALPDAGMLFSAEISEDSTGYTNKHVKNYLDLNFDIQREK